MKMSSDPSSGGHGATTPNSNSGGGSVSGASNGNGGGGPGGPGPGGVGMGGPGGPSPNNTQSIADYLAQLLKDKKALTAFPNVFLHLERLLDDGKRDGQTRASDRTADEDLLWALESSLTVRALS